MKRVLLLFQCPWSWRRALCHVVLSIESWQNPILCQVFSKDIIKYQSHSKMSLVLQCCVLPISLSRLDTLLSSDQGFFFLKLKLCAPPTPNSSIVPKLFHPVAQARNLEGIFGNSIASQSIIKSFFILSPRYLMSMSAHFQQHCLHRVQATGLTNLHSYNSLLSGPLTSVPVSLPHPPTSFFK